MLAAESPIMQQAAEDRESVFKMKGKVVRLVHLYLFKFGEYFVNYQDACFQAIW